MATLRIVLIGLFLITTASAATLVVANKAEATVSLLDLESGKVVATLPAGQGPHEVAVSPDGARVLVSTYGTREREGSTLTVIDVPGASLVKTIDLGEYRKPHGVEWLDRRHGVHRPSLAFEGLARSRRSTP